MKLNETISLPKKKWYFTQQFEKALMIGVDIFAMLLALAVAIVSIGLIKFQAGSAEFTHWLNIQSAALFTSYLGFIALGLLAFELRGNYSKRKPYSNEIRDVLTVVMTLALINAAIFSLGRVEFSRGRFIANLCLLPPILLLCRAASKFVLRRLGGWVRPMVIIGWGENAVETAYAFDSESMMGYDLIAFLIPDGEAQSEYEFRDRKGRLVPFIALGRDPVQTLSFLGDPQVVLALEQGGIDTHQDLIQQLSRKNRELQIVPAVRGLPLYGMEANHFFAHEVLLLSVRNNLGRRLPRLVKRVFDLTVSLCMLVAGLPILIWIGVNVMRSGFPIFYGHKRIGQGKKSFACYKFRTMAPNADQLLAQLLASDPAARAEWDRDFKLKNDPRITRIGHFLRRTSLDELPQLWNVLKGDMSLVGPRPVVTAELERYGTQVDYYLEAKPGITGLWQVSGRNDVTYDTRVYLDAWYVKNWSLFNDIVILVRTIKVIFRKDGAY